MEVAEESVEEGKESRNHAVEWQLRKEGKQGGEFVLQWWLL